MQRIEEIRKRLTLPVVVAPMFIVSGTSLLIASCRAGLVGSIAAGSARTAEQLEEWLQEITRALDGTDAIWAVNVLVSQSHNQIGRASCRERG